MNKVHVKEASPKLAARGDDDAAVVVDTADVDVAMGGGTTNRPNNFNTERTNGTVKDEKATYRRVRR